MKIKLVLKIALAVIFVLVNTTGATGTSYNPLYGARTLSLNGLYIAGADGLNSSFINPSGLAFLKGRGFEISVIDRMEQNQFSKINSELHKSLRNDNINFAGGAYFSLSDEMSLALSYNRVLNYDVQWPFAVYVKQDTISAMAAYDMFNKMKVDVLTPGFAYRFGNISLGITANIYYVSHQASFPQGNLNWFIGKGLVAYPLNIEQNAWTIGLTLGMMADLTNSLRFGAFFNSGYKAALKGTAKTNMFNALDSITSTSTEISSDFHVPLSFGLGFIYKLSNQLELNVDAAMRLWNGIQKNMNIRYSNAVWQNNLTRGDTLSGINATVMQSSYSNTIEAGFGLEYTVKEGLLYRFGYRYSQSPNTEDTYNFLFPAVSQHWISAGIRYTESEFFVDAALAYSFGVEKEVTKTGINSNLSGRYSANSFIPSITLHYAL